MPNTKKACPHCRTSVLEFHDYQGHELDLCRDCGGLWFEQTELDGTIIQFDDERDESDYTLGLGARQGVTDMSCPDCANPLQAFHVMEGYALEIDICRRCQGAWVERDELDKISHSSQIRKALLELGQSISWKSWVFQILSRMPVEYNIKPRGKAWVTWGLVLLNSLIFFAYAFNPLLSGVVIDYYAIAATQVLAGEHLWTFFSHMFLHGSVMHLVGNMYFLWIIGDNLEDVLGHRRYFWIYLLCGLASAFVSALVDPYSPIPTVGASGAIAGLFAMYMLWFPNAKLSFMFVVIQKKLSVAWYFFIWLALNFAGAYSGEGGVDYWAHIAGFATGGLVAWALREKIWKENPLIAHLAGPEVRV